MENFKFELNQEVTIVDTQLTGTIVARAEYTTMPPQYWVHYTTAQGNLAKDWFLSEDLA